MLAALLCLGEPGRPQAAQLLLRPLALEAGTGAPDVALRSLSGPILASPSSLLAGPSLVCPAPMLMPIVSAPAVSEVPQAPAGRMSLRPAPAMKPAEMSAGVQAITEGLMRLKAPTPVDVHEAGESVEDILMGRSRGPAQPAQAVELARAEPRASQEELAFAARSSLDLAALAEDWGAERGLKFSRMQGQDFLGMIAGGMARYAEQYRAQAPSPQAYAAAATVQAQAIRMVKAILKPGEPLEGQIRRTLSVWNVFNQAMEEASQKGSLQAIEDEARLFADQVEQSV
jgi:hypothetical protein